MNLYMNLHTRWAKITITQSKLETDCFCDIGLHNLRYLQQIEENLDIHIRILNNATNY